MPPITRDSLMTLEAYTKARPVLRAETMAHKKNRLVHLGEHIALMFEDEKTLRYQIQEMLRVEKTFEEQGIQDELSAYTPLLPDGHNWKATMLIEYTDETERRRMLALLKGVEDQVYVQVGECDKVFAIADEDMERENAEKTSSVHFLRFDLTRSMMDALQTGAGLAMGVQHPNYAAQLATVPEATRTALMADLVF
ncbi:MAG: DUF3501 family protein [Pseudomonadota bacterium]